MFDLQGNRINKKQAEKLKTLFEYLQNMHEQVDEIGYYDFKEGQGLTDSYDDVVNAADDIFIAFGFADKRLEEKD